MKTPTLAATAFVIALCVTGGAFANGRKPVAQITIEAQIETTEGKSDVYNVRLSQGSEHPSSFEVKKGPIKETIKLSTVKSIVFVELSNSDKEHGIFNVLLNTAEDPRKVVLRIEKEGQPLKLEGMTRDHTTFEVSLVDCLSVKFAPQGELHKDPEWPVRAPAPAD